MKTKVTLTSKQFYEEYIKPYLKKDDKPYNRQLYNDTKDGLNKDGLITDKQASKWTYPSNKFFN